MLVTNELLFSCQNLYISCMLKCLPTTWVDFQLQDSQCYSHLECQIQGANHDLQIIMFIMLKNGLCCFKHILPWKKKLINYYIDNWLCNANIASRLD